ncbi:PilN Tfp pilus assembly protein PilN [Methylophilaceae bacterium]
MIIRVNLLPHREIKREARQRQFNLMALLTASGALALVVLNYSFINSRIDTQLSRNARLEAGIVQLDQQIGDIKNLQEKIGVMLARKQVVENLQINRSQSVVVLDELSRQLPEGMYFKSIKQQGPLLSLEGVADTNARVASLVRNLTASKWLENPQLIEIKSVLVNGIKQNEFLLTVQIRISNSEQELLPPAGSRGQAS